MALALDHWFIERTDDPQIVQQICLREPPPSSQDFKGYRIVKERVLRLLTEHPSWFHEAVRADTAGNLSQAIDIVFDHVDKLLASGAFESIDSILKKSPTEKVSIGFMMALLSITLPASNHLPSREAFFVRVWDACVAQGKDARKLIGGLKRWE